MYKAIVCRINTRPHPGADKIQLGTAHGYQVVVSLDTKDGDMGIYFNTDGQLSEEFAKANDLIGYTDDQGVKRGGFFSKNRRVKSQTFRGEKSEGYWCPLSCLAFTGFDLSSLKEGDQLDELNEVPICNKYFTPATLKVIGNQKKQGFKRSNNCFHKHKETAQFKTEARKIPANSIIYMSEKAHGTSGRTGHVLETKTYRSSIWRKMGQWLRFKRADATYGVDEWCYLTGTKNIILRDPNTDKGFYDDESFRHRCAAPFYGNLHKGEVVYYEIVGFTQPGRPIMQSVGTDILKDKAFTKQYGSHMVYKYGCVDGTCDIYVYRITRVNEDGDAIDLPLTQMLKRCKELGVKPVPQFNFFLQFPEDGSTDIIEIHDGGGVVRPYVYDGNVETLTDIANTFVDGPSTLDSSHIREGVCLRIENENGVTILKHKSHTFGILEGYIKEQDTYVDMEETS